MSKAETKCPFQYELIRSNRKTLAITIKEDGDIQIRAPKGLSVRYIEQFLQKKSDWIQKKIRLQQTRFEKQNQYRLAYGELAMLQGNPYPIIAVEGNRASFDGAKFLLPANLSELEIKHTMIQLYKMLAKYILDEKVVFYAKKMGVSPEKVKINGAKTRWGSCSNKKNLNFSWRTVLASNEAIDYVVVHELAHLIEFNHSPQFWAIVKEILPDYKMRKERLSEVQHILKAL